MKKTFCHIFLALLCLHANAVQYTVSNTNDTGAGSLRWAINGANGSVGLDTISFNIPGAGVQQILLGSALPNITDPVLIDGYSQPGSSPNTEQQSSDAILLVEVHGNNLGVPGFRLSVGSGGSTIQGIIMHSFSDRSIVINVGSDGNNILGNFIGTNSAGTATQGSGSGVEVFSANNDIGGTSRPDRNLITGNPGGPGLLISGSSATDNDVKANFFGMAANGTTVIGGLLNGIRVEAGAQDNIIGGIDWFDPNRITGTSQQGLLVVGGTTVGTDVYANHIYQTGGFPFDLNGDGHSPNDPGDGDGGANGTPNYPTIIRGITDADGYIYVEMSHQGNPWQNYRFDWYEVGTAHPSGHSDHYRWMGRSYASTNGGGTLQGHFTFGRNIDIPAGSIITVTATQVSSGNTSEAAQNFMLGFGELKVTNTSDLVNGTTTSVLDLIANPGFDGISLREAILAGNSTYTAWGHDHIMFDIPGSGPHVIAPNSPLPNLLSQFHIDGYSEPNYSGTPSVIIDGTSAGSNTNGLNVYWDWCDINGICIVNFDGSGLYIIEDNGDLTGCFLGVMPNGTTAAGNGRYGVRLDDAYNWELGEEYGDRNLISGNDIAGMRIDGPDSYNNVVMYCYVGTNHNGTGQVPNSDDGIILSGGAHDNVIGTTDGSRRNIISGNGGKGIHINHADCANNSVIGNYIGVDVSGNAPLGNNDDGIAIDYGTDNTVGGSSSAERNIISDNGDDGVDISYVGATGNSVIGNYIGVGANGTSALGNGDNGVAIESGATACSVGGDGATLGNVIANSGDYNVTLSGGGTNVVQGNLIGTDHTGTVPASNNNESGVLVDDSQGNLIGGIGANTRNVISAHPDFGIRVRDPGSTGNRIEGNFIGTDINGLNDLGNGLDGIVLRDADNNTIGGATSAHRNILSGNDNDGIWVTGDSDDNIIQNNWIGLDANGDPLGNLYHGIGLDDTSDRNRFEGNTIANNVWDGIAVTDNAVDNAIIGNEFYANGELGIDHDNNGVTNNDGTDNDGGPNNLQNFPLLYNASMQGGGSLRITGELRSEANKDYRLEFFNNPLGNEDGTGHGEGMQYMGTTDVSTDGSGFAAIDATMFFTVAVDDRISSTATELVSGVPRSTSEFSMNTVASAVELCWNGIDDDGDGLTDCEDPDCSAFDNDADQVCDDRDLDDDNDGILDLDENACADTPAAAISWNHNNPPPEQASNYAPTVIASAADVTSGAGLGVTFTATRMHISGVGSGGLDQAIANDDYLEYELTTLPGINAAAVGQIRFTKHPASSAVVPENYGYSVAVQVSDDGFVTSNTLVYDHYIDKVLPPTWSSVPILGPQAPYQWEPASTYTYRVYLFNKADPDFAIVDDFVIEMHFCGGLLDQDADGVYNHLDLDSDNDGIYDCVEAGHYDPHTSGIVNGGVDADGIPNVVSNGSGGVDYTYANSDGSGSLDPYELDSDSDLCNDVIEAGYVDHNDDGELGDVPLTVDGDGLVTSGGP